MTNRGFGLLTCGLLALVSSSALADEKVFRLKNGRKIQGEVVEETATTLVIRTPGGGRTTLDKGQIVKTEDAPKPEKAPEKPPEDTPASDPHDKRGAVPTPGPEKPAPGKPSAPGGAVDRPDDEGRVPQAAKV